MLIYNENRIPEDIGTFRFIRDRMYSLRNKIEDAKSKLKIKGVNLPEDVVNALQILDYARDATIDCYTACTFKVGETQEIVEKRKETGKRLQETLRKTKKEKSKSENKPDPDPKEPVEPKQKKTRVRRKRN